MDKTKDYCPDCYFSDIEIVDTVNDDGTHADLPHMLCRRFPPVMVCIGGQESASPYYPLVHETEWCGEFLPKEEKS